MSRESLLWLENILLERFGHHFHLANIGKFFKLHLSGHSGEIRFPDLRADFLSATSGMSCAEWNPVPEGWYCVLGKSLPAPVADSLASPLIEKKDGFYHIHYDIISLAYWMLSRLEEVGRTDLDDHGRFPASSSHAYKYGYLDRPIVDEWLQVLGQVIQRQWPNLILKHHEPITLVSCDIDNPYLYYSKMFKSTLRVMLGDIVKRKSPGLAFRDFVRFFKMRYGDFSWDPYVENIRWIMEVNEDVGNKVAFYFISGCSNEKYDSYYGMDEPIIRSLLREISARGHGVGFHASYDSYDDKQLFCCEVDILRMAMQEEGVFQKEIGGRQHYLRWKTPVTANNWHAAGLVYDSSLGYADHPGFRCGTCFEYPMYDPVKNCQLDVRQRPLILMECSVIDDAYMGLGYSGDTLGYMKLIKERCYLFGGNFTLLWHNSHFKTVEDRNFYLELID